MTKMTNFYSLTDLEFCMSQHGCLGKAVPTFHQVNHIKHGQEGQWDVDITAGAWALQVRDVVVVH